MCRSVLNDEWISQPTFATEEAGFIAHKKNVYEEALHRSEEERHEYDFHIEAHLSPFTLVGNKIMRWDDGKLPNKRSRSLVLGMALNFRA